MIKEDVKIAAQKWTMMDVAKEKDRLAEINPDYLKTLNKTNARIFIRQYPDFLNTDKIIDNRRLVLFIVN